MIIVLVEMMMKQWLDGEVISARWAVIRERSIGTVASKRVLVLKWMVVSSNCS